MPKGRQTRRRQARLVRRWELQELQGLMQGLILKERRMRESESQSKKVEG